MGIFVSVEKTVECVVIAVALACALLLIMYKTTGILQSCGYSNGKLLKWFKKKNNLAFQRLGLLALACVLSCAVLGLCFSFAGSWASVISLIAYAVFLSVYAYADNRIALRCPATLTHRFKRLLAISWLIYAIVGYFLVTLINFADYVWGNALFSVLKYCVLSVLPPLAPFLVMLANLVAQIYEVPHNKKFIKNAKAKLAASEIKVIGITGSYGKTSAKNILSSLLDGKFKVLSTPRSHNTPMGIAMSVNNNNLDDYDVFIAEMGARHVGDIAELCAICPPDYSMITGICSQHLESFLTVENIVKAKGEIIGATKEICVVSGECYDSFKDIDGRIEKCDCVKDVASDASGTQFILCLGGEEKKVKTKLLGEHSAYNIGLCAQVAFNLGLTLDEIAAKIEGLDFIEHRLQLIKTNGVNILDDGYNANVKGAEAAITVLKYFPEKRIVVTPGLVELGILEDKENFALGEKLAGLDAVILVGETLIGAIKEGYLSAGGQKEKLFTAPTLTEAQTLLRGIIKAGDTVLFLNDLPDIY